MIFGGLDSDASRPKTVELFNWETGEHCTLSDLPYGVSSFSGTVMDGIPVFCGGYTHSGQSGLCQKYNIEKKEWEQV